MKQIEERLKMHQQREADEENARLKNIARRGNSFAARDENFKAIVMANQVGFEITHYAELQALHPVTREGRLRKTPEGKG